MSDESAILINLLKVKPGKQEGLIALLKQNTDTVVRTLHGWKTTRLIAAKDGAGVPVACRPTDAYYAQRSGTYIQINR
jgi:hypothetical protein